MVGKRLLVSIYFFNLTVPRLVFSVLHFIYGPKLIVPLLGCIKHIIVFNEIKSNIAVILFYKRAL